MTLPLIVQPLPFAPVTGGSSTGAGHGNLATPNPKEAFVAASAGTATLVVDFGGAAVFDTVFLGFTNLAEGTPVDLFADGVAIGTAWASHSYRRGPARHAFVALDTGVAATRLELRVPGGEVPLVVGVLAAGLSIRASGGAEQDWGRPIGDGSTVTRLPGGGFGIDRAVAAGGYQWTMPALTDVERDRLYALQLDVGIGGTILVLEDPAATLGRNETAHWGVIAKPDVFARQAPGESRWPWQLQDWA